MSNFLFSIVIYSLFDQHSSLPNNRKGSTRIHLFDSQPLGMSSVGFLITAIPILLLGLGGIELTQWYQTRHLIDTALMQAARHASFTHTKPAQIEQTFEQALLPLFASGGSSTQQQQHYFKQIQQQTKLPAWRIQINNPKHSHFIDFHRDDLDIAKQTGLLAIDNNYQYEQHQRKGIGIASQQSIYDANTLTMTITYAYKPLLPGINTLIRSLQIFTQEEYSKQLLNKGFLPITQRLSISMQSHPIAWPSAISGKVITDNPSPPHKAPNITLANYSSTTLSQRECSQGIWCQNTQRSSVEHTNNRVASPLSHHGEQSAPTNHFAENHPATSDAPIDTPDKHPLCGISLCCEPSS